MENQEKVWDLVQMCYYGHLEMVIKAIEEGVDVNSKANGYSPLMAAKQGENQDIIEFLLSIGAKE